MWSLGALIYYMCSRESLFSDSDEETAINLFKIYEVSTLIDKISYSAELKTIIKGLLNIYTE
jgi:hypothetical protein